MKRELLSIYGPFSINSYGVAIAVGVCLFIWLIKRDSKAIALSIPDKIMDIVMISIGAGIIGGRLLYVISEPEVRFCFSELFAWGNGGGFSILGAVAAIIVALTCFLKKISVPVLPFLDIIALYTPLLQSISRIGCFFAGCCYGAPTELFWGYVYTDTASMAPLYQALHPTQLYSALSLFFIFLFLYFVVQKISVKRGQLFGAYLFCISMERFLIDFWRDDRIFSQNFVIHFLFLDYLSVYQLIALTMGVSSFLFLIYISFISKRTSPHDSVEPYSVNSNEYI